jgi:hypothetical protein
VVKPPRQRLQRREFGAQVQAVRIEAAFQRHPDAAEDLRRLTERQRFAEALRQVMVRVDEARHQQPSWQRQRRQLRLPCRHLGQRAEVGEAAVAHQHAEPGSRAFGQQRPFGCEQQLAGAERAAPLIGLLRIGLLRNGLSRIGLSRIGLLRIDLHF